MKRTGIAAILVLGAFALHADQTTTQAPAPQPQPVDSPLVRAAKATNRSATKKKKIVITNDTLVKAGGHVTTSNEAKAQLPTNLNADPALAKMAEEQRKEEAAAAAASLKAKKEAEAKKLKVEKTKAVYEGDDAEGMLDDPALVEGQMQQQAPPQTQQPTTMGTEQPKQMDVAKPPAE